MYVHLLRSELLLSDVIVAPATIDVLPDIALLDIFDFYLYEEQIEAWHTLVHVCQKWRNVIFGSPHRLDLRLHCKARSPVREMLDVWPLLPIAVWSNGHRIWGMDNVIAALEHNDRICEIGLFDIPTSQLEKVLEAMTQPFPALTRLHLRSRHETAPVDPNLFLGGSAERLQTLWLNCIPFPELPKLLLTAPHLVDLDLRRIPHSGYISPEEMVTGLSVLTRLERLLIGFESPRSRPDQRSQRHGLPPPTRALLPVLTKLCLFGVSEYLEDLVAQIDAPLLNKLAITFFNRLIFHTPQLARFISRTPKLEAQDEARVAFSDWDVSVTLPHPSDGALELGVSCRQSEWQLSSLAQVCSVSFPRALIPVVEHLFIFEDGFPRLRWQDDIENSQWLELFHSFTAVKYLYISSEFTPRIAPTLQELVIEKVIEVLPALQSLFLEGPSPSGPVQEYIGQFVAARQLAGHPIAVSRWERKSHPPLETAKLNWASE
jgi:hypothetical protein